MSCNGCRVLRKGCGEGCVLRPCLQWIESPESQGYATLFVAKFFGRAGLMEFISGVPETERTALFQSLLYEACGRTVDPVYGAVGLLWAGKWHLCQEAVKRVLTSGGINTPMISPNNNNSSANLPHHYHNHHHLHPHHKLISVKRNIFGLNHLSNPVINANHAHPAANPTANDAPNCSGILQMPPFAQPSPSFVNRSNVIAMGHAANHESAAGHRVMIQGLVHEAPNHAIQCHYVHDHDHDQKVMILPNPNPNPIPNPNPNSNPNPNPNSNSNPNPNPNYNSNPNPNPNAYPNSNPNPNPNPNHDKCIHPLLDINDPNNTLCKRLKLIQPEDHSALNLNMQVMPTHHNDNGDDNNTLTTNNNHHNNRICNDHNQLAGPANYVATDYKCSSSSHISSGLGQVDQTNPNINNFTGSGTQNDQEEIKIELDLTLNSSSSSSNLSSNSSSSSCHDHAHDHDHNFSLSLSSAQLTSVKLLNLLV